MRSRALLAWFSAATVTLSIATATPAAAIPNIKCKLATPVHEVQSITDLPADLFRLLPPMADIGAPFNKTDSVDDPNLPFRRLIRAGNHDTDWFVWYEHGGVGYSWQAAVVRVIPGNQAKVLANAGTVSDMLCTFTDGVYAGQIPPYPQGMWAANDF